MPRPGSWALLPTTYPNLAGAPVSPTLRPPACQVLCRAMLGTQRIYAGDIKASGAQTWMGRGQTWLGSHHLVSFRSSPERKWPAGVCLLHLCPHQLLSGDKPGSQSRPMEDGSHPNRRAFVWGTLSSLPSSYVGWDTSSGLPWHPV